MKQSNSFLNTHNGDFLLIEGEIITAETTFTILRKRLSNHKIWDVGTGYYWLFFGDCIFEGKLFNVSLCFKGERLLLVNFSMNERQTSWEDWSEKYELETEKYYEQWVIEHIGKQRTFSWGTIKAHYDHKGGGTVISIRYAGKSYIRNVFNPQAIHFYLLFLILLL